MEAGGRGIDRPGEHAARIDGERGDVGVYHGYKSLFVQDQSGNIAHTHSVSAGLDYPGIGPEHALLAETGRATYTSVTDDQVMHAFGYTAQSEGILPALESAHALAYAYQLAPTLSPDQTILINLSGR